MSKVNKTIRVKAWAVMNINVKYLHGAFFSRTDATGAKRVIEGTYPAFTKLDIVPCEIVYKVNKTKK